MFCFFLLTEICSSEAIIDKLLNLLELVQQKVIFYVALGFGVSLELTDFFTLPPTPGSGMTPVPVFLLSSYALLPSQHAVLCYFLVHKEQDHYRALSWKCCTHTIEGFMVLLLQEINLVHNGFQTDLICSSKVIIDKLLNLLELVQQKVIFYVALSFGCRSRVKVDSDSAVIWLLNGCFNDFV